MKNLEILPISKYTFLLSFISGNICLFGYILTNEIFFAIAGFYLLFIAGAINLLVLVGLVIYGLLNKLILNICLKSAAILLINIPIAWLYAAIGASMV